MSLVKKIAIGIAVTFGALVMIGACGAAVSAPSTPGSSIVAALPGNANGDVSVSQCLAEDSSPLGLSQVTVRVTNTTDRVQSYMITVSINDAQGNRLTEANGASNSVLPGQSATADLVGTAVTGASSCAVANVTRVPV